MQQVKTNEVALKILAYIQLKNHFVTWGYDQADRIFKPEGLEIMKSFINRTCVCVAVKTGKDKDLETYLLKLKAKVVRTGGVFIQVRTLVEYQEWYQFYSTTGKP